MTLKYKWKISTEVDGDGDGAYTLEAGYDKAKGGLNYTQIVFITQFSMMSARKFFPCFDEPALKVCGRVPFCDELLVYVHCKLGISI